MFLPSLFRATCPFRCSNVSAPLVRNISNFIVLGIETSFDDTGCAIVSSDGQVLGEALKSQQEFHLHLGGVIPPVARQLHEASIKSVIDECFSSAKLSLQDIDAVATTVKPGLPDSLHVGLQHGRSLAIEGKKPFIPIHHMEAHALTARMIDKDVEFPFLVALISGSHALLAIAHSVSEFSLLGSAIDSAPGELIDKVARRAKLRNLPEFKNLGGGKAIEMCAKNGNPLAFEFCLPVTSYNDCNLSFAGLRTYAFKYMVEKELKHDLPPDAVIPEIADLCASFQLALSKHLCQRLQRAMLFAEKKNIFPSGKERTLVLSGGVACNKFIQKLVDNLCSEMGYRLCVPPGRLCTDNGVMIAWNGVERFRTNCGVLDHNEIDSIAVESKAPLGEDWRKQVKEAGIQVNAKNRIRVENM